MGGGGWGVGVGGGGRKSEGSTADTARKRPERPWTAARTMEVLRRCPLVMDPSTAPPLCRCYREQRHCTTLAVVSLIGRYHKRRTARGPV